jgi:hypothetical protein
VDEPRADEVFTPKLPARFGITAELPPEDLDGGGAALVLG